MPDKEKDKIQHKPMYTKSKFWIFLNSSFGLWVLSTLLIGGITFLYSNYTDSKKTNLRNETTINKLDLEIKSRLFYVADNINYTNIPIVIKSHF